MYDSENDCLLRKIFTARVWISRLLTGCKPSDLLRSPELMGWSQYSLALGDAYWSSFTTSRSFKHNSESKSKVFVLDMFNFSLPQSDYRNMMIVAP